MMAVLVREQNMLGITRGVCVEIMVLGIPLK